MEKCSSSLHINIPEDTTLLLNHSKHVFFFFFIKEHFLYFSLAALLHSPVISCVDIYSMSALRLALSVWYPLGLLFIGFNTFCKSQLVIAYVLAQSVWNDLKPRRTLTSYPRFESYAGLNPISCFVGKPSSHTPYH